MNRDGPLRSVLQGLFEHQLEVEGSGTLIRNEKIGGRSYQAWKGNQRNMGCDLMTCGKLACFSLRLIY